tara:strand:+ start:12113 stop:12694 length:582 start_codon:yes stop_codon:yes gene_type:complete
MGNLTDFFPAATSNNVLEVIHGVCDGRSITVDSGTYTLANVTSGQDLTTTSSYVDITGSSFTYTPPSDAKYVSYKFDFHWDAKYSAGISHFKLLVDNTEITKAYQQYSNNYSGNHGHHHGAFEATIYAVFDLTVAYDNAANAQFANWASDKTIKVKGREYSASYQAAAHYVEYSGTFGGLSYLPPQLTIIAFS